MIRLLLWSAVLAVLATLAFLALTPDPYAPEEPRTWPTTASPTATAPLSDGPSSP